MSNPRRKRPVNVPSGPKKKATRGPSSYKMSPPSMGRPDVPKPQAQPDPSAQRSDGGVERRQQGGRGGRGGQQGMLGMPGASGQLHTNTPRPKQFHVRVTFEARHVFTKGPQALQKYTGDRALKATLTLDEFTDLKNRVESEVNDNQRSPEQINITSYVQSVFSIVARFVEGKILPEKGALGFDFKVQIWHLKGNRSTSPNLSNNNGAAKHTNNMRKTCSKRVWCIDTDGLDPSLELVNQTVETNVDPMYYLANTCQTKKIFKSWIFEPQHEPLNFDRPAPWRCSVHQAKGVEHVVIFNRPNLEGITRCGEEESFAKMLHLWRSKQSDFSPEERHKITDMVRHFGLKPTFMINDASVSKAMKNLTYPTKAVEAVARLFETAFESSASVLPLISLSFSRDEFCDVFDIPPELRKYIVAGGVCAVKQSNEFKHLPLATQAYDEQTVASSLAVREVRINLLEKTGNTFRVRSTWSEASNLTLT